MLRTLALPISITTFFLAYTIYSQDLSIKESKEYERKIIIYSKVKCSYCAKAKDLLDKIDLKYVDIDITWDREQHAKLKQETGQNTVPYIFINSQFVGGYQDLLSLENSGQLKKIVQQK